MCTRGAQAGCPGCVRERSIELGDSNPIVRPWYNLTQRRVCRRVLHSLWMDSLKPPLCETAFSLQHALDCKLGGLRIIQHNEVRDTLAQCMREAGCSAVEIEPQLQPLEGEQFDYKSANKDDEARSDIKCCGFWNNMRQAYFDVKVVSPFARSNAPLKPAQLFKNAERSKIREYGERIRNVDHGDFTPLVFTCAGGMAPKSHLVLKRLAEKLSERQNIQLSVVSGWLRCRLSFALLRTTLLCVRATRRKKIACDTSSRSLRRGWTIDYLGLILDHSPLHSPHSHPLHQPPQHFTHPLQPTLRMPQLRGQPLLLVFSKALSSASTDLPVFGPWTGESLSDGLGLPSHDLPSSEEE